MMGVDPRRFGPHVTRGYLRRKAEEAYANVFSVHYPDEERATARPLKRSPCCGRMRDLGAVFGSVYGWERPNWFAPPGYGLDEAELAKPDTLRRDNHPPLRAGERPREKWSFRRSNCFPFVGAECRHVAENAGLLDMTAFAKFEVSGPGAETWLDGIFSQPTAPAGRADRAVPPAVREWRRALRIHCLQVRTGLLLSGVGGRL
jgi:dimethylglycine dehydrogenase